ncbi:phosphate ABC transporter substrate-binding protein [Brevibacillus brevis]|uniref:phosphate ABC transporter substrate-binding protein n=1 Tax=Brevibacillus brevis TaxID=1393 RepID=UPI0025A64911|nr:phosphate ABC transporter substrate-binding protein [Brevibacillus brevis]WJQ82132.1 phosphate ABC transporter substrate-binding protein [Brevibacillus brevis]
MKKLSKMFFALTCVGALLAGCGSGNTAQTQTQTPAPAQQPAQEQSNSGSTTKTSGEPVTAVGSTALQPLVEQAAKDFMAKNAGAQIQVQGGGSGTGLSQVASGAATIGNSDIFAEEKKGIPANELVDHKVSVVGMAAAVSPKVKVDNLTKQQLIDIFTGKITNWKEVGGDDMKITLVNRPKSSGTRATFSKFALDGKEEAEGITEDSSGTVRKIIAETPGAIGYLALSYFNDTVKALKLDGVEANAENITTNKYPVWAYEHMYTKGEATGDAKAFLDFILTDEVQKKTVTELGFLPITDMKVERDAEGKVTQK